MAEDVVIVNTKTDMLLSEFNQIIIDNILCEYKYGR